jgi:hypothetical protein
MHINICDICTTDTLSGSYAYKHLWYLYNRHSVWFPCISTFVISVQQILCLVLMHINICDICTTDTLSGSHAYQHLWYLYNRHSVWFPCISIQLPALILIQTAYLLKHSWFYSNLPTGILYSQLNTSVSLPDSEYTKVFKCLHCQTAPEPDFQSTVDRT